LEPIFSKTKLAEGETLPPKLFRIFFVFRSSFGQCFGPPLRIRFLEVEASNSVGVVIADFVATHSLSLSLAKEIRDDSAVEG
jgi:hypothetical protein